MRHKVVFEFSLILALAIALVSNLSALACEPGDSDPLRCETWRPPKVVPTPKAVVANVAKPAPTSVPVVNTASGTNPADALEPNDTWQLIGPNATIWYKIGSGINPQKLEVWVDTNGKEGIGLAVYSPEQYNAIWNGVPPKGRGSPNKVLKHDLYWNGQDPAGGTWYFVVSNTTSKLMDYKAGYNRVETPRKSCESYWESMAGSPTYWTACR